MATSSSKSGRSRKTAASGPSRGSKGGKSGGKGSMSPRLAGKHLVIVESPTKAKTVNRYVGDAYVVMPSVGHVRDLTTRSPKGTKMPVPGVDVENDFAPTYEVMASQKKTVTELRKAAKEAVDVWFATDMDREGEAIAWHLAEALGVPLKNAKRVVFNAITKSEIEKAFSDPHLINENRVNAQQARRILDRIVGFQVSPLLWKKVTSGLSAGRVQSVAVRLVVEREREIDAFVPDEFWKITAHLSADPQRAPQLAQAWRSWMDELGDGKERTVADRQAWLNTNACFAAELVEVDGEPFQVVQGAKALAVAQRLGFAIDRRVESEDPKAKGSARLRCVFHGHVADPQPYTVKSIQTKRTKSRPSAPFITSTLQQVAANRMRFPLRRTMRVAQQLYEGVDIHGRGGQVGLITYMRTDSTHLSPEAVNMARLYIGTEWGEDYLPDKPNTFPSPNRSAQEAHEAIRPTDASITPRRVRKELTDEQYKLYQIIWERFLASQMKPAEWDLTTVLVDVVGDGQPGSAVFKATGRTLVFDGFYKATGVPSSTGNGEAAILPPLSESQVVAPIQIDPSQHFTSPPPRYTEASLQKKLEEEGIGRPSTYAPIIATIQDRKYVQPIAPRDRRLAATDLGTVVTDMLVESFPKVMDVAYTRDMEEELDKIEKGDHDWQTMLREFYGPFKENLERAYDQLTHAKAVTQPAPHKCAKCDAATMYRFGRNGKFLSCTRYPDCDYAAPIDSEGNPVEPEQCDILCPQCNGNMTHRVGRFGPFLGCEDYPKCKGIVKLDPKKGVIVLPKPPPLLTDLKCPKCDSPLNLRRSKRGPWLSCSTFPKCRGRLGWGTIEPAQKKKLEDALAGHETDNPVPQIRTVEGVIIGDDYVPRIGNAEPTANSADAVETDAA